MPSIQRRQDTPRAMREQAAGRFAPDIVDNHAVRDLVLEDRANALGWSNEWKSAPSEATITRAHYLEAGDRTVTRLQARSVDDGPMGGLPDSGKRLDVPLREMRWQDGKAVEEAIYHDTATTMAQPDHTPSAS